LYRGVPGATSGVTDGASAGIHAHAGHSDARTCLAALQGGQAGAHPRQSRARPAGAVGQNLPRIKTATSPAN